MLSSQLFLLGGGASVRYLGAIEQGLFSFLQNKFCIGINYSYKFVQTTCNLGVDETMYNNETTHAEIAALPLWIGKEHKDLKNREQNSIFLKPSKVYDRVLKAGVYKASLSGLFALSLGIKFMSFEQTNPEIYLLGYDYSKAAHLVDSKGRPVSHWYQEDFEHRGTGKVNWYQQTGIAEDTKQRIAYADLEFRPFAKETKVKIYNVGGTSLIPHFEHLSYEEFFMKQYTAVQDQNKLCTDLKECLWAIKRENNI